MRLVRYSLAIALGALVISPALGQVRKGMVEVAFTGSLGWNQSQSTTTIPSIQVPPVESDAWSIGVSGHAGYFVSKRIDVGGFLGFNYSDSDTSFAGMESSSTTRGSSLGPGFNYHFTPQSRVVPFVGADVGVSHSRSKISSATGTSDGWFALARVGADLFLNPHVAVKFGVAYRRQSVDGEFSGGITQTRSDASYDALNLFVGLAIFLN